MHFLLSPSSWKIFDQFFANPNCELCLFFVPFVDRTTFNVAQSGVLAPARSRTALIVVAIFRNLRAFVFLSAKKFRQLTKVIAFIAIVVRTLFIASFHTSFVILKIIDHLALFLFELMSVLIYRQNRGDMCSNIEKLKKYMKN